MSEFFELTWEASDPECLDLITRAGVCIPPDKLLQLRGQWLTSFTPLERGQKDLRLYLLKQLRGSLDPAHLEALSDADLESHWAIAQTQP